MSSWRGATLVVGVTAYVAGAVLWLGQERLRDKVTFPAGSVHSLAPEGCALAYRYLQATATAGARVHILAQPLGLEALASNAVVLRLRPKPPPRHVEEAGEQGKNDKQNPQPPKSAAPPLVSKDEERWVRGGGRLVIAVDGEYRGVAVRTLAADASLAKVFPVWPGVARLQPPVRRAFETRRAAEGYALFTLGPHALLWRWPLGGGEVLWLSTPEVLDNRALANADHLALLAALAGTGRDVYFDEDAHGLGWRAGLMELLLHWGLGPSLVLGTLAFALLLWRHRTPIGASEDAPWPHRSEAIDLIDSMALLYERVLSRREALDRYARAFERAVALRTGLAGRTLAARVRALAGEGLPPAAGAAEIGAPDFARGLARINTAFRRLADHAHPRRGR